MIITQRADEVGAGIHQAARLRFWLVRSSRTTKVRSSDGRPMSLGERRRRIQRARPPAMRGGERRTFAMARETPATRATPVRRSMRRSIRTDESIQRSYKRLRFCRYGAGEGGFGPEVGIFRK